MFYTYGPPHTSDLHYRLTHYATETNQHIYNCSRDKKTCQQNAITVTLQKTTSTYSQSGNR